MGNALSMAAEIAKLSAAQVARNEAVKQQYINIYNAVWGEGGERSYEREANNFQKQMRDNEKLQTCTSLSTYFAFIDLAVKGISLDTGTQAQAYLLPRKHKATGANGANGQTVWENRCNLTVSAYGELFLRMRAGQIHHADNPVIVYEGDEFSYGEIDGRKVVNYNLRFPRQSTRIIGCFMRIVRVDGSVDYAVMTESDWTRLSLYSAKNNAYTDKNGQRVEKANELYTSWHGQIDPGFLAAKCVKHAFKSYPKLDIGRGTQLETTIIDQQPEETDYYGLGEPAQAPADAPQQAQAAPAPQAPDFGPDKDTSAGVTVQTTDDDTF